MIIEDKQQIFAVVGVIPAVAVNIVGWVTLSPPPVSVNELMWKLACAPLFAWMLGFGAAAAVYFVVTAWDRTRIAPRFIAVVSETPYQSHETS